MKSRTDQEPSGANTPWAPRHRWQRRLHHMPLLQRSQWRRQAVLWCGAVLIAVVAVFFARAADAAQGAFFRMLAGRPWLAFVITPAGLGISVWLTRTIFRGAQGSGIPQAIAALHVDEPAQIRAVLSLRIGAGKILLTLLGLASGASIGREGPTVQVGASIMHSMGRLLGRPPIEVQRMLVLAGGAAGISAAFNTPLAGIVFAIEELAHSFEQRTSGVVLTTLILGGMTTIALAGNYTYFGQAGVEIISVHDWIAVLPCAVIGGLGGGIFSGGLVAASRGLPGPLGRFVMRHPVAFAVLCGLALAAIGTLTAGATYGTGYPQARALVEGHDVFGVGFTLGKFAATVISYLAGIPGGIFAPSLAVGAGIGASLHGLLPSIPLGVFVLLGMVGYFSGAVQTPITATVIVMEMTNDQEMTIPLLATAFLAFGISKLVCGRPFYSGLARNFLAALHRHQG